MVNTTDQYREIVGTHFRVARRQGKFGGNFFKVGEKSGNIELCQGSSDF